MKTQMLPVTNEEGKEVGYEAKGSYRGIITDEKTGKKYSVQGNDWSGDKSSRFYFAQADSVTITELEADGVTPKKDGMLIQGVHYHEHEKRHGRGIDAWVEHMEDHVDVFPDGKGSHVGYYLSGGFGKFSGSLKGIYSVRNAEDAQEEKMSEVSKNDKLHDVYKALYQKKYAGLVKELIKASQEIRDEAKSKAQTKTKSAENSRATSNIEKTQRQA